jgi:REP element-mobilizing transposase RayT
MPVRKHPRLKSYDYGQAGCYFVTVCTKEKRPTLSRIVGRGLAPAESPRVELSRIGNILQKQILALPDRFPSVTVDHFVIMPTHFHMLISVRETAGASPRPTLPQIVGACKSLTTRFANMNECMPGRQIFQTSFHEHVVRDDAEFLSYWTYIDGNPGLWREDEYYCE